MLAWLSVWSEVQTCIWPSWCHYHSLSVASVKSRLVLPFWYRLTQCVCVCVFRSLWFCVVRFVGFWFLFSTEPRDWLGRTSVKWPILCRVGHKTLLLSSSQMKFLAASTWDHPCCHSTSPILRFTGRCRVESHLASLALVKVFQGQRFWFFFDLFRQSQNIEEKTQGQVTCCYQCRAWNRDHVEWQMPALCWHIGAANLQSEYEQFAQSGLCVADLNCYGRKSS